MKRARRARSTAAPRRSRTRSADPAGAIPDSTARILEERASHTETGPVLTGGDLDADWQRAWSDGEEAVGGSVATPDQDVVDEIGRAWGVEQRPAVPVRTSGEILEARDARRLVRESAEAARQAREAASRRRQP
jgi:hypothetical protein